MSLASSRPIIRVLVRGSATVGTYDCNFCIADSTSANNAQAAGSVLDCCFDSWLAVQGNINLIEAAAKKGVKKFILLTSIGVGDSKDAPPEQVYDVLKPVLIEKGKAEERLKVSTLTLGIKTKYKFSFKCIKDLILQDQWLQV